MAPLAPPAEKSCSRQRHAAAAGPREPQRSASFHGRSAAEQRHPPLKQRPRTQPDLLAGVRGRDYRAADGEPAGRRAAPSKVLVTVAVQQSMWPLHVMASTEWSVADLVAAVVRLYVKEGRRPLLPATDMSHFGLHYSQFSLEGLDSNEKLMELGSRSFFLCPKSAAAAVASSSACSSSHEANRASSKASTVPWLGFTHFWPLL